MTWTPFSPSVHRWTVEPMLAVLTVTLTAVWVIEPIFVFDGGIDSTIVDLVLIPAMLLIPGLLAVSVLARVVRYGVRLASAYVSSDNRAQGDEISLLRIGTSLIFGGLAGYTLWWVIGSMYVLTIADAGGVVLAPLVALVAGSVLGLLLLARIVLSLLKSSVDNTFW
jgi:hypothetical protein